MIIVILGILKVGGVYVFFDFIYLSDCISFMLEDVNINFLLI